VAAGALGCANGLCGLAVDWLVAGSPPPRRGVGRDAGRSVDDADGCGWLALCASPVEVGVGMGVAVRLARDWGPACSGVTAGWPDLPARALSSLVA
jgi:hypothetical protein